MAAGSTGLGVSLCCLKFPLLKKGSHPLPSLLIYDQKIREPILPLPLPFTLSDSYKLSSWVCPWWNLPPGEGEWIPASLPSCSIFCLSEHFSLWDFKDLNSVNLFVTLFCTLLQIRDHILLIIDFFCLVQWLAHGRHLINVCWMSDWVSE